MLKLMISRIVMSTKNIQAAPEELYHCYTGHFSMCEANLITPLHYVTKLLHPIAREIEVCPETSSISIIPQKIITENSIPM